LSYRERYLVEATYASSIERDAEKSVTAYLAVLERYPTDGTALNNIGIEYSVLGRRAERDDAHWRAMTAGTAMALTYTNYMGSQVTQGNVTALDTALKLFADRFPTSPQVLQWSASLAGMQLEWDEVAAIANEVRSSHPTLGPWAHDRLSDVAQLYGHLDEASREQDQRLRIFAQRQELTPEDRDFRIELQRVERQVEFAEQPSEWLDELEALWQTNVELTGELGPNQHRYRRFSRAFARAGAADRAQELLDLDLAWRPQTQMETLGFRLGLRRDQALIAIADGRPEDAVELLRDARRDTACPWCDLPRLAFAYDQEGNADSALAYYHLYLDTPGFRSAWDWDALTFRRLGELHEARGDTEDAVEFYGQLIELWEDADPVLQPIVTDVRGRLARLVGERR
jgi:tetratricopeptide (TPR) repeat protein